MEDGFTRVHIDVASGDRLIPIRRELGISTFGVNLIALEPRQRQRIHRHPTQEEAYIVLEGELTLVIEGEEHVLGPFDAIRVAPALRRPHTNPGSERGMGRPSRAGTTSRVDRPRSFRYPTICPPERLRAPSRPCRP